MPVSHIPQPAQDTSQRIIVSRGNGRLRAFREFRRTDRAGSYGSPGIRRIFPVERSILEVVRLVLIQVL